MKIKRYRIHRQVSHNYFYPRGIAMNLNEQQKAIVETSGGKIAVVAGAGSGKTSTTIELICKLYNIEGVPLEKMFISTFTNKSGRDLKVKLSKKLGISKDTLEKLWIGTFHSLGYRYLTQIKKMKLNIILPVEAAHYLKNIYKQVIKDEGEDENNVTFDDMSNSIEKFRNTQCTWDQASPYPEICEKIHIIYQKEKTEQSLVDFNDILAMFSEQLKIDPMFTTKFSWVFVDECQDNNIIQGDIANSLSKKNAVYVGDSKQCWEENELIPVKKGDVIINVPAIDVEIGDLVQTLHGHRNLGYAPITEKKIFFDDLKYTIITQSDKKINVSQDHLFLVNKDYSAKNYVYLMHRRDLGYRIGISSKNLRHRSVCEHAKRLWVLKVCADKDEALYYEKKYSLLYQIPTSPYVHRPQAMSQEKVKLLFEEFGRKNYKQLFHDFNLDFDNPHYIAEQSDITESRQIIRVKLTRLSETRKVGGRGYSFEVCLGTEDKLIKEVVSSLGIKTRKVFRVYKEAYLHAQKIKDVLLLGGYVAVFIESINFNRQPHYLNKSKALLPGMKTLVIDSGSVFSEKIKEVFYEKVKTKFVSLEVSDTGIICSTSGVVSHNSIYGFRGAAPHLFKEMAKSADKVYPLSYNYRSSPQIINFANILLKQMPQFDGQELISTSSNGNLPEFTICDNAALETFKGIKNDIKRGVPLDEIAVLGRSVKPVTVQSLLVLLRQAGIPYTVRGGADKLNAPYIQNYLSVLKSVIKPTKVSLVNAMGILPAVGPKTAMKLAETVVSNENKLSILKDDSARYCQTKAFKDYIHLESLKDNNKELLLKGLDFIYEHHLVSHYGKKDPAEPTNKKNIIFDVLYEYLLGFKTVSEGIDSLYINEDDIDADKGKVVVSTIHQVKGLEYDSVHIMNMNEFGIPFLKVEDEEDPARLEEEFCLAYVACTRARKHLRMYMQFMSGNMDWAKPNKISRFIKEVYKSTQERYFTLRVLDVEDEAHYKQMIYLKAKGQ